MMVLSVNTTCAATISGNESNEAAAVHALNSESTSMLNNNTTIEIYQEPHTVNQFQEDQHTEVAMDVDEPNKHISTSVSGNQLLHNNNNEKDELGIKLRLIESMLLQCSHLIKQSTSTNVSHEEFVKRVYNYVTNLVISSNELQQLCSRQIDQLNKDRDNISLIEPNKQNFIERDPGSYPQSYNYTPEERRFLVNLGPFQPNLSNFPKNDTMAAAKDTCKFVGPGGQKKDKAWIDVGVSSWSKMKGRGRGKKDENRRKAQQQETAILERNKNIIITLIDSARFLCRQGLAFRREPAEEGNFIQLINLLRRRDALFDDWFNQKQIEKYQVSYLSAQSQDEFIKLLGEHVQQTIIDLVNTSPFYSIMIDSTPDASHREIYTVVVRYTNDFNVEERLITATELPSKVGLDISNLLFDVLEKFNISTDKLIAQCYDNASNMSGVNKGVQACVTNKLRREIIFIPCGAHSSNLAVKYACDCGTEFISLFNLLQEIYNYFTKSIKRHYVLRQELESSEFGVLVKSLADTRWTANFETLHAIDVSFEQIVESLSIISEVITDKDDAHQAKCLKQKLLSFETMFLLFFMINVTRVTHALTSHLQGKQLDIITAISIISNTLKLIQNMRNDDVTMINMIQRTVRRAETFDIDIDMEFQKLHRPRKPSQRIDNNQCTAVTLTRDQYYTKLMRQVLDHLYSGFNDYLITITNKLRYFHNLSPDRIKQFSFNDAEQLCSIVPGLSSPSLVLTEFELLRQDISACTTIDQVIAHLRTVGHAYPRASLVYNFLITLPVTVASNERSFSKMKIIKNYLRNALKNEKFAHLMLCAVEYDILSTVDLDKMAAKWGQMKNRRVKVTCDK
ncbi:unnamed protein product [Rotaria sordida]|uniref:Uncharacterized protein n=2 Tax=Rotaria sordida TaxID=392033 RepID=A0A818RNE4_9BILA|nr:unnamed protein product [Rotaria sordida]CAF3941673.1 unnamed protein product [Rotaria sordida]